MPPIQPHRIEIELYATRFMYGLISSDTHMTELIAHMSRFDRDANHEYIMTRLYSPFANVAEYLTSISDMPVYLDKHIEIIQCDILSQWDGFCDKDSYMLMVLHKHHDHYILAIPELPIMYNIDPSTYILEWLDTYNIDISSYNRRYIQYTGMVGDDSDILIYSGVIGDHIDNTKLKQINRNLLNKIISKL